MLRRLFAPTLSCAIALACTDASTPNEAPTEDAGAGTLDGAAVEPADAGSGERPDAGPAAPRPRDAGTVDAGPAAPVAPRAIHAYFFGPSMFDITPAGDRIDGDGIRVRPENLGRSLGRWMCDAAVAGGHACRADGSFASITLTPVMQHYLTLDPADGIHTPQDRWTLEHRHGPRSCRETTGGGFADCAPAFNVAILTNNNFEWIPEEGRTPYLDRGTPAAADALIEAWREASNTAEESRFFLYIAPPSLEGGGFASSFDAWRNDDPELGWRAYQAANLEVLDAMAYGDSVRLIPASQLWAEILRDGGMFGTLFREVADFSWDDAPHGYWWFYLLSGLLATMVVTEAPIPADYALPTLPTGPGFATAEASEAAGGVAEVPSPLRDGYRALLDHWWSRLHDPDLAPRVFGR